VDLASQLEQKHLAKAEELHKEVPIFFTGKDGKTYHGSIDLLFKVGQEWYLADYKFSGRAAEELQKFYAAQMNVYREGLAQAGIEIRPENVVMLGYQVQDEAPLQSLKVNTIPRQQICMMRVAGEEKYLIFLALFLYQKGRFLHPLRVHVNQGIIKN
jgi:predicted RecB family nuclease